MSQLVFQSTSGGQVNLIGATTASTFNINVPATSGTMVTTGDSGTVTNTMLAATTGSGSVALSTSPTLTSPTLVTPALGTPSSATLTNATGLPLATGVTGQLPVANGGTGTTTSTGTGSVVLSASPALTGSTTVQGLTLGKGGGAVSDNTAFGYSALINNSSGYSNTVTGYGAASQITTGYQNTAIGLSSVATATTAFGNTGVGYQALNTTTGSANIGVGANAGSNITSGNYNVVLGSYGGGSAPISATGSNWVVLSDGQGNVRQAIDSAGNTQFVGGGVVYYCPTPTSFSTNTTLTNANIQSQIIVTTSNPVLTMPLGTTLESLISWSGVNIGYDFIVINNGTSVSIAANTGVTLVGPASVNNAGRFRIRRTAANTFIVYRVS